MTSYTFAHYVLQMMTLHNYAMSAKTETIGAGVEKVKNFSKTRQSNYQKFPYNLTKIMNTHTLYFCPQIRKLQVFEILKWAQESQWRKQRTPASTREIQLILLQL